MTEEEKRQKLLSIYKDDDLEDKDGVSHRQYAEYQDVTGGMHYTPAPTPSTTSHRDYATYSQAKSYMDLSPTQKADKRLYNQWQAYQKAIDARKNAKLFSRDEYKASELAKSLKQELKKAYTERYGSDAGFGKWLASGTMTGLMGFANGVYQTAGMVEDALTNTANNAYWTLNHGIGGPDRWMKSYFGDNPNEDDPMYKVYTAYKNAQAARKGAGAGSGVSGDTWMSAEEQLRDRLEEMYRERVGDNNLFDPEGGLFHQLAERSNELYNWNQEQNQIQTEFQKTRSGNDKAWDIANQLVIGTAQAVPYAAFGMAGMGAAGGEIGAQLAPQTTSILEKVASTIQGYVKDPNYWLAFSQETGNTYREALDAGANQDTAALTATLVGLINGAVELGLGGDNAGIQDLPERLMKAGKGTRKAVQEWIESAVSEGKEEAIQGVISNLAEKIGYNRSKAWIGEGGVIDPKALAQEGYMGMAVGGILGGGQSLGVNAYNRSVQNRIAEQYKQTGARFRGKVDTIIENALALPETTEAYKQAQELKSRQSEDLTEEQKKSLYSDEEIGRLYSQTLRDTGVDYNARADALSAIEQRLQKLGETSNTRETAELVLEAAERGALSSTEKATALKNSKYGQRVLNEYRDALSGELVPQYDSEWADELLLREKTKQAAPELTQEERTARTEWAEQVINNNKSPANINPAEEADIDKLAQKYGEQANVFKEAAKSVEGTDLYYFDDAYHLVYQEAKAGLSEDTIRRDVKASLLSPAAFKLAYNAGQSEIKMPKGSRFTGSAGVRLNGIDYKSLNNKQRASVRALQRIAQLTGIRIELFDSTQADGTLGEKQGWYSKGAIGIDINAGMLDKGDILNVAMLRTTSHELTHFIQDNNDTAYKELKDFVFSALQTYQFSDGKYRDADTWIRSKMSQNKWEYEEGTAEFNKYYQKASDECVADACEMMLRDSTAFETLAKENQSLAQRMLDWLKQLIADIKKAFSGVVEASLEAKAMLDSLDELQQKWDAALVGAVQNTKLTAEETTQLNEAGVEVNEDYATVNSVRYLLDADKKAQLAKLLAKKYGVTEQEAKAWMNAETSLASMILNPKYSAYLDYEADTDEQAIKSNSDYPQGTVDFSNICAKRREFTMIVNRILRMFPNHVFAATDLAKMRTIMEEEGMTVPCAICYVEDRRQHDTLVAQSFIDNLQRYRDGEATDINGKKFGKGQIKAFDMVKGDEYTPTIYELASLEGLNQLKAKDDTMKKAWETYNNARGMASIRLPLNDAEYDRQILKYSPNTVKRKNDHGGLRIYSFSDLEMFHLIDIIQVITDSSVVGLKIQGYTKVNEYAKAVRNTGEKLNRSLIPAGDLGYHIENGKVILDYDTKEGIDINHPDFFDSKDNANVGNIVIGINPTQIRAAMVSDFVDMIIPFHTGQSSAVLQEKGLAAWQNYKDSQTEKDLDTGRTSDHQINIYTEVLQVLENEGAEINKRSFVEKFLEVCKENNLRPRFAEFLNVDENGDYVYTEGYHKFLVDFKTFAQTEVGEYLPQLAVKPDFDNEYISTMLEQYVKDQKVKDAEIAEKAPRVLERIRDEIVNDDVQNSLRVTPEQDAENEDIRYQNRIGDIDESEETPKEKTPTNPYYAKKDLRTDMLNLFSIPAGRRAEMGAIIDKYADKMLEAGAITQYDYDDLIDELYENGVIVENAAPEYAEARKILKGKKVYVPERVRIDFGDDWSAFRKRAFSAGIYLTNNTEDMHPDQWNATLAADLPGLFDAQELDERTMLEQMVDYANLGKSEQVPLNKYESKLVKQGVVDEETLSDEYERKVQQQLEKFAEKAKLEVVLRERSDKVINKQRAALETARRRTRSAAVRKSITAIMDRWNTKLTSNTPAKNIPAQFAAAMSELSQAMDLTSDKPLSPAAVDKLTKLWAVYESIDNDKDFSIYKDPVVAQMVDNIVTNIINDTKVRYMSLEQLNELYAALKALDTVMRTATKAKDAAYRGSIYEIGKQLMLETNEARASKSEFWRDLNTWQLTPRRFFAMLGGWKKGSVWETQVAKSFEDGRRRALRVERDHYNHYKAFTEAKEMDRLTDIHKLVDIGLLDRNGKPVKITRGMMLSIYMHLLAEDNRRAILYGGFNIPDLVKYYGNKIAAAYGTGHENTVGILEDMTKLSREILDINENDDLTEEEKHEKIAEIAKKQHNLEKEGYDRLDALKNRIYNEMSDFEKKLCEAVTAWNDGKSRDYINEVNMEMYGIKRARVKNYYRIHRDTSFVQTDFASISKNANLNNVGWLKDRVKSAAPVLLTDIVYEIDNGIKSLSTYYGFVKAQTDFTKIYNVKRSGANVSVKGTVGDKFGKGPKSFGVTADQYIENFIGDVVGSRLKPEATIFAAIRRNLPRATLTLNPRVALSQVASVPTAAAEVGWGSMIRGFAKGIPHAFSKSYKENLASNSEYFFQRYRGEGGMREFADMKSGSNALDKLWNKMANTAVGRVLFNWCQDADVFATTTMWSMAEDWVAHNTDLKGEEFDAAVKEKFEDILIDTQPNYTPTERSDLLRDTREMYKFLTMYKTQSNQNYNILVEANARLRRTASDFKNGKNGVTQQDLKEARKQFANAYTGLFIGGTLTFIGFRALVNALLGHMNEYRNDDDEITTVSVLEGLTKAYMQSIAGMFVLGTEIENAIESVVTGKKYYGLEDSALSTVGNGVESFINLAQAYAQGKTDNIGGKWAKFAQNTLQTAGLPYSSVKTFVEGGKTWINDIERGTFGQFEGNVTRSNTTNYNRLYQALENGDTAKADRIREEIRRNSPDIEDKTIESGLRGVIKGMLEDGLITTDEAVDKLVEYTGKDPDTAYWDVQKWSNKANAEDDEKYTDSNYYRLWQVIDSDGDAEAAMSELLEHGKDADQIAQDVRKHIKDAYTNGEITDTQARERMLKYGQHKENKQIVPYTKAEVDKLVNGWVTSNTLGWDYDDKETLYAKGEISKSELKTALVDIGGMTSEKADQRIEIMDWNKEGYAVENDKYDSIIGEYNKKLKSHGISKSIWYNYYVFESKTSGEVDANGKSIPYSKMRKLFEYIGNLNITNDQKMALARTYTDSESSIAKYKTW